MRRYTIATLTTALVLALGGIVFAQGHQRGFSKVVLNGHTVSIDYGKPSLKGRTITDLLKELPETGWRLGANSSTTFTTDTDLKFGDVTVPKGTYSLWAERQSDNSWKLAFNKQHGQWGTQHDPKLDFAFVPLNETKASSDAQTLVINLEKKGDGAALLIHWGDMELTTNFTAS